VRPHFIEGAPCCAEFAPLFNGKREALTFGFKDRIAHAGMTLECFGSSAT
jgi:hypothetical protein